MARSVWALLPEEIVELIINTQEPDARSWLASIISVASHEDLTKVVVDLWAIWHARRKALYEDIF
jgi:frataxin-like iron-binding protein CyaY